MTRERDRYRRASWGEQVREAFLAFWRNRTARLVAAILLAIVLILRLLTPDVVPQSRLAVRDCLYLRPAGQSDLVSVQPIAATPAELQAHDQAERASCDLSHSHEVADVFDVGTTGQDYPGLDTLVATHGARCESALRAITGPAGDQRYATALWTPNETAWQGGARVGACLVFNADRSLLDHRIITGTPLTRPGEAA